MDIAIGIPGAAALLAVAAVAMAVGSIGERVAGALVAATGWGICVAGYGAATGTVIAGLLGMAAASALVFVLALRPRVARPLALVTCVGAGLLLLASP